MRRSAISVMPTTPALFASVSALTACNARAAAVRSHAIVANAPLKSSAIPRNGVDLYPSCYRSVSRSACGRGSHAPIVCNRDVRRRPTVRRGRGARRNAAQPIARAVCRALLADRVGEGFRPSSVAVQKSASFLLCPDGSFATFPSMETCVCFTLDCDQFADIPDRQFRGHNRTHAPQQTTSARLQRASSLDHLVGEREQRSRHGEAEQPGGLGVDDQLEF